MNCQKIRPDLTEAARGSTALAPVLARHVEGCADCAAFYRSQLALTEAVRALPNIDAPASIRARVFAEFDRARFAPSIGLGWRVGAVAALGAVLAVGFAFLPRSTKSTETAAQPFIEIPYT